MADCVCLPTCIFFNDKMASMPIAADMMKKKFCRSDNSACGRYMVFSTLGKAQVPQDLYPNQADRAKTILAQAGKPVK
jgi:hypothetical protein